MSIRSWFSLLRSLRTACWPGPPASRPVQGRLHCRSHRLLNSNRGSSTRCFHLVSCSLTRFRVPCRVRDIAACAFCMHHGLFNLLHPSDRVGNIRCLEKVRLATEPASLRNKHQRTTVSLDFCHHFEDNKRWITMMATMMVACQHERRKEVNEQMSDESGMAHLSVWMARRSIVLVASLHGTGQGGRNPILACTTDDVGPWAGTTGGCLPCSFESSEARKTCCSKWARHPTPWTLDSGCGSVGSKHNSGRRLHLICQQTLVGPCVYKFSHRTPGEKQLKPRVLTGRH